MVLRNLCEVKLGRKAGASYIEYYRLWLGIPTLDFEGKLRRGF